MDCSKELIFNPSRICRLCLSQAGVMSPIFEDGDTTLPPLSSKITTIISIQLYANDGLPSIICHRCLYQVEKSYDFKAQCETSDVMLRKYMSAIHSSFSQRLQDSLEGKEPGSVPEAFNIKSQTPKPITQYNDSPFKRKRGRPRKEENLIFYSSPVHPSMDGNSYHDDQIKIVDGIESVVTVVDPRSEMLSNSDDEVKNEVEMNHLEPEAEASEAEAAKVANDEETLKSLAIARAKAKEYMSVVVGVDGNGVRSRRHLCIGCGKTFNHSSDLRKHVLVHTGERPFHCRICTKTFSRRTNLNKHMKVHTGQKPFCCTNCPKSFATKGDLGRHLVIHSGIKPFSCHICNQCFSRKDKLTRHIKLHETNSVRKLNFKCTVCPNIYHSKVDLKHHVELDHYKEDKIEDFDGDGNSNAEEICRDEESSNELKIEDSSNCGEIKMAELSNCEDGEGEEDEDEEDEGRKAEEESEEVESMVINIDPFQVDTGLSDGYPYWERDKPKTDDDQSRDGMLVAVMKKSVKRGKTAAEGKMKELECKICEKKFTEVTYLRSHMATHSSHKPHQCSMCTKAFTRRRELLRHENVHTGFKPFVCHTCNKAFSRKDKLARHEKIHNGVQKLHGCRWCKASFLRAEDLATHTDAAHSEPSSRVQSCSEVLVNGTEYESEADEDSEEEEDEEEERERKEGKEGNVSSPLEQLNGNPAITVTSIPKQRPS